MSKEPATPQAGGEPPSRARGANASPPQPPGTRRSRHASERQAALHDGAGTSAAMATHGGHEHHVKLQLPSQEGGQVLQYLAQRQERASRGGGRTPGNGGAGVARQPTAGRPKPYYVPPWKARQEQQPPYAGRKNYGPYPLGGVQEERLATPPPQAGAPPAVKGLSRPGEDRKPIRTKKKETRKTTFWGPVPPVAHDDAHPHPHQLTPGEATPPNGDSFAAPPVGGSLTTPAGGGGLPTPGGAAAPGGAPPRGRIGVPTNKTIERVSTLEFAPVVPPGKKGRPSPLLLPERKKKRKPAAICFTLCCILFWLLVVGIGVAVLVVYLLYHPQPPRLRVTTATLNAAYVDQLPPPRGGLALNSDLYVLATIYSPNTKIDIVLRYMQLDLFFHGVMIGTQAVWPPIHEEPSESAIRSVHLVVSEVRMSQEDAELWHNVTTGGGLVELQLRAKFHVQLNFGRWLPFRYWVYPSCSLWLDPPPGGALRRARCRK